MGWGKRLLILGLFIVMIVVSAFLFLHFYYLPRYGCDGYTFNRGGYPGHWHASKQYNLLELKSRADSLDYSTNIWNPNVGEYPVDSYNERFGTNYSLNDTIRAGNFTYSVIDGIVCCNDTTLELIKEVKNNGKIKIWIWRPRVCDMNSTQVMSVTQTERCDINEGQLLEQLKNMLEELGLGDEWDNEMHIRQTIIAKWA